MRASSQVASVLGASVLPARVSRAPLPDDEPRRGVCECRSSKIASTSVDGFGPSSLSSSALGLLLPGPWFTSVTHGSRRLSMGPRRTASRPVDAVVFARCGSVPQERSKAVGGLGEEPWDRRAELVAVVDSRPDRTCGLPLDHSRARSTSTTSSRVPGASRGHAESDDLLERRTPGASMLQRLLDALALLLERPGSLLRSRSSTLPVAASSDRHGVLGGFFGAHRPWTYRDPRGCRANRP